MPHMGRSIHAVRAKPKDARPRPRRIRPRPGRLKPRLPPYRNRIVAKKTSQTEKRPVDRTRVKIAIAGAVMLACLAFAVPRMFDAPSVDPVVARVAAKPSGPRPPSPAAVAAAAQAAAAAKAASAPRPVVVE